MYFYLIGIDYRAAPICAREAVYRKRKELDELLSGVNFKGSAVLFTCNRIELYGITKDLFEARVLIGIFRGKFNEFADYGYIRFGRNEVFKHLLRVASGLESQIKGEPQILGQLNTWRVKSDFPKPFFDLITKAVSFAKVIRAKSGLGRVNNNIAAFVSQDLLARFKPHERLEVIIVGTGKIAELFTLDSQARFYLYFAAHKNYIKAQELARRSGGEALELKNLQERLPKIDALVSATNSPHFLFDEDFFLKAVSARKKPLYLYDLAIPRDINPNVGNLPGIILNNLDTLAGVIDEYNKNQSVNVLLAEGMIEEATGEDQEKLYEDGFKDRDAAQPFSYKTS